MALYTDSFPISGHAALDARGIAKKHVPYLLPSIPKDYTNDVRFYDCWSKLTPFSLTEYERVVQLDSDMLILRNMDELMDLQLDGPEMKGEGSRVFGAAHACVCNPLSKPHYPSNWYVSSFCGMKNGLGMNCVATGSRPIASIRANTPILNSHPALRLQHQQPSAFPMAASRL